MKCPKCENALRRGHLEFRQPFWLMLTFFLRQDCYFWAEGFGERELFSTRSETPAWYCDRCGIVVVDGGDEPGRGT